MKCEVFSRVVGYYRPVSAWNAGKKEEYKDRKEYIIKDTKKMQQSITSFGDSPSQCVLVTSKTCPNCPQAKEYIISSSLAHTVVDASGDAGYVMAKRFGVTVVPTALFLDANGDILARISGSDNIKQYIDSL